MDRTTELYLEECRTPGSRLRHAVADADLPPVLTRVSGHRLLPRPLFVSQRELRSFERDVDALFDVLVSLPARLFDGDHARFHAALGVGARESALLSRLGASTPPRYGRTDMYHDGDGFKLLEFNIVSQVGGVDRAGRLPSALMDVPAFAEFAVAHRLRFTDTGREVAETLRAAGLTVTHGSEPVVAVVEAPGELDLYRYSWEPFQELMHGWGLDVRLGELHDLDVRDSGVFLACEPDTPRVDVLLRAFGIDQVCAAPESESQLERVVRAHQDGRVVLWTPMGGELYGNKGCLALLHDPAFHGAFSVAERALIDRLVPWTGAVDGRVDAYALSHREELVLKPNGGTGGTGVVAGWQLSDEAWAAALASARRSGAVVQRRVVPRTEPVVDPADGQVTDWHAVLGMYITPSGQAGCNARALPAEQAVVIGNGASPDTRTAAVFVVAD
ncbi:circularly permuted type 2 ATP-grasp protein [Streptacidiphilus fuscans]|uniref:Circularly permuted type 2 ATP-grasp protein n=1 Tax=Streptacidiphilus fuscans TaxID=2789292 RepID=A0A931BA56_9ACTN|nr:circularly permuted type 2 ATP-grasp protein [Streptacidiphilus fuscans]MBF9069690.1 circularly permuted type 2 ATP-grasp protein [Streptacidiphilus fuscans]